LATTHPPPSPPLDEPLEDPDELPLDEPLEDPDELPLDELVEPLLDEPLPPLEPPLDPPLDDETPLEDPLLLLAEPSGVPESFPDGCAVPPVSIPQEAAVTTATPATKRKPRSRIPARPVYLTR
jgi:hypothetical protein